MLSGWGAPWETPGVLDYKPQTLPEWYYSSKMRLANAKPELVPH